MYTPHQLLCSVSILYNHNISKSSKKQDFNTKSHFTLIRYKNWTLVVVGKFCMPYPQKTQLIHSKR